MAAHSNPMYTFMDEQFNQCGVEKDNVVDAPHLLEDGPACEQTFCEVRAILLELPTSVVREVTYAEPAVTGDTAGKVSKPASIASGLGASVPLFVSTGDKLAIVRGWRSTGGGSEPSGTVQVQPSSRNFTITVRATAILLGNFLVTNEFIALV